MGGSVCHRAASLSASRNNEASRALTGAVLAMTVRAQNRAFRDLPQNARPRPHPHHCADVMRLQFVIVVVEIKTRRVRFRAFRTTVLRFHVRQSNPNRLGAFTHTPILGAGILRLMPTRVLPCEFDVPAVFGRHHPNGIAAVLAQASRHSTFLGAPVPLSTWR